MLFHGPVLGNVQGRLHRQKVRSLHRWADCCGRDGASPRCQMGWWFPQGQPAGPSLFQGPCAPGLAIHRGIPETPPATGQVWPPPPLPVTKTVPGH